MARLMRRLFQPRVPYVPQMEVAECGAACLAMILAAHGHHIAMIEARDACNVSRDGATAYSLARAAQARGLDVVALRLDSADDLGEVSCPAVVHLATNHFVVLERCARGRAYVVDPAAGRRRMPIAELFAAASPVVMTFAPGPDFVRRAASRSSRDTYLKVLGHYAPTLGLVFAACVAVELLNLVFPAAGQVLIDFVIRPRQDDWIWVLAAVLALATVLRLAMLWLRDRVTHVLNHLLDVGFLTRFVDRLFRLPLSFFQSRTTGDVMDRLGSSLELRVYCTRMISGALNAIVLIVFGAVLLAYDPRLGAIVAALSLARVVVLGLLQRRSTEAALVEQTHRGRESSTLVEAFGSPELTKLSPVRRHLIDRYTDRLHARLSAEMERRRITEGVSQLTIVLDGVMHALVIWIGGTQFFAGRITLGVYAAFLTLNSMLLRPLEGVLFTLVQLGRLRGILARADDVFETGLEVSGDETPRTIAGGIRLESVCFRYGQQSPTVVDNVSLEIAPGERIAIVGRSGMGKSTLARLIAGLIEPTEGVVVVDGVPLPRWERSVFRRHLGVVLQETFLFDDTVRNNLALKDPDAPFEAIKQAAILAHIHDFIEALPDGYDTMIGQHGHRLSGGQRQRFAIARAIVGSPRILVLDEATSSLDLPLEARVYQSLGSLDCTRIVVAHRLATVRDADRILVVHDGRIVEEGTYQELVQGSGIFRQMVATMERRSLACP
jgi:ABC-type bacteriocin/lantibiotic exporter with double-glycine peptidase domain